MSYYTIADFQNILFNGMNMKLEDQIKNILKDLSGKLVVNDNDDTNYQKIKRCMMNL